MSDISNPGSELSPLGPGAFATRYGQTPLDPDAYEFLTERYAAIQTLAQLNEAEALNIEKAIAWLDRQNFDLADFLHQGTLRLLHLKMYGDVWTWAGTYRHRDTNIGIEPAEIAGQLEMNLGNIRWQLENNVVNAIEAGIRLHRSMTAIHPFPNGNGRHARLYAEKFAETAGLPRDTYSWGLKTYSDPEAARRDYLAALRHADQTGDHGPLLKIATS